MLSLALPPRNMAVDYKEHGYEIEQFVGKGQFGKAYRVRSISDDSTWLAKAIDLTSLDEKDKLQSLQEAAVMQKLRHPGVVFCKESFIHQNMFLVIVMEYCTQGDLAGRMDLLRQRNEHFSEEEILRVLVQLAEALKYIHAKRIIHRDIKPSNIFLTEDGDVKIGDFGISRVMNATLALATTAVGTPQYMCPEMCENKPYTSKSDMWALGCVLYEMAALKNAFEGDSFIGLVWSIAFRPPDRIPPRYNQAMQHIIDDLLQKDPKLRMTPQALLSLPYIAGFRANKQAAMTPPTMSNLISGTVASSEVTLTANSSSTTTVSPAPDSNSADATCNTATARASRASPNRRNSLTAFARMHSLPPGQVRDQLVLILSRIKSRLAKKRLSIETVLRLVLKRKDLSGVKGQAMKSAIHKVLQQPRKDSEAPAGESGMTTDDEQGSSTPCANDDVSRPTSGDGGSSFRSYGVPRSFGGPNTCSVNWAAYKRGECPLILEGNEGVGSEEESGSEGLSKGRRDFMTRQFNESVGDPEASSDDGSAEGEGVADALPEFETLEVNLAWLKRAAFRFELGVTFAEVEFLWCRLEAELSSIKVQDIMHLIDQQDLQAYSQAKRNARRLLAEQTEVADSERTRGLTLMEAFEQFDAMRAHCVAKSHFRTVLHLFYPKLELPEMDSLYDLADKTVHGDILYVEFVLRVLKLSTRSRGMRKRQTDRHSLESPLRAGGEELNRRGGDDYLNYDDDHSGSSVGSGTETSQYSSSTGTTATTSTCREAASSSCYNRATSNNVAPSGSNVASSVRSSPSVSPETLLCCPPSSSATGSAPSPAYSAQSASTAQENGERKSGLVAAAGHSSVDTIDEVAALERLDVEDATCHEVSETELMDRDLTTSVKSKLALNLKGTADEKEDFPETCSRAEFSGGCGSGSTTTTTLASRAAVNLTPERLPFEPMKGGGAGVGRGGVLIAKGAGEGEGRLNCEAARKTKTSERSSALLPSVWTVHGYLKGSPRSADQTVLGKVHHQVNRHSEGTAGNLLAPLIISETLSSVASTTPSPPSLRYAGSNAQMSPKSAKEGSENTLSLSPLGLTSPAQSCLSDLTGGSFTRTSATAIVMIGGARDQGKSSRMNGDSAHRMSDSIVGCGRRMQVGGGASAAETSGSYQTAAWTADLSPFSEADHVDGDDSADDQKSYERHHQPHCSDSGLASPSRSHSDETPSGRVCRERIFGENFSRCGGTTQLYRDTKRSVHFRQRGEAVIGANYETSAKRKYDSCGRLNLNITRGTSAAEGRVTATTSVRSGPRMEVDRMLSGDGDDCDGHHPEPRSQSRFMEGSGQARRNSSSSTTSSPEPTEDALRSSKYEWRGSTAAHQARPLPLGDAGDETPPSALAARHRHILNTAHVSDPGGYRRTDSNATTRIRMMESPSPHLSVVVPPAPQSANLLRRRSSQSIASQETQQQRGTRHVGGAAKRRRNDGFFVYAEDVAQHGDGLTDRSGGYERSCHKEVPLPEASFAATIAAWRGEVHRHRTSDAAEHEPRKRVGETARCCDSTGAASAQRSKHSSAQLNSWVNGSSSTQQRSATALQLQTSNNSTSTTLHTSQENLPGSSPPRPRYTDRPNSGATRTEALADLPSAPYARRRRSSCPNISSSCNPLGGADNAAFADRAAAHSATSRGGAAYWDSTTNGLVTSTISDRNRSYHRKCLTVIQGRLDCLVALGKVVDRLQSERSLACRCLSSAATAALPAAASSQIEDFKIVMSQTREARRLTDVAVHNARRSLFLNSKSSSSALLMDAESVSTPHKNNNTCGDTEAAALAFYALVTSQSVNVVPPREKTTFTALVCKACVSLDSLVSKLQAHRERLDSLALTLCELGDVRELNSKEMMRFAPSGAKGRRGSATPRAAAPLPLSWVARFSAGAEQYNRRIQELLSWTDAMAAVISALPQVSDVPTAYDRDEDPSGLRLYVEVLRQKEDVAKEAAFISSSKPSRSLKDDWDSSRLFMELVVARKKRNELPLNVSASGGGMLDSAVFERLSRLELELLQLTGNLEPQQWRELTELCLDRLSGTAEVVLSQFWERVELRKNIVAAIPANSVEEAAVASLRSLSVMSTTSNRNNIKLSRASMKAATGHQQGQMRAPLLPHSLVLRTTKQDGRRMTCHRSSSVLMTDDSAASNSEDERVRDVEVVAEDGLRLRDDGGGKLGVGRDEGRQQAAVGLRSTQRGESKYTNTTQQHDSGDDTDTSTRAVEGRRLGGSHEPSFMVQRVCAKISRRRRASAGDIYDVEPRSSLGRTSWLNRQQRYKYGCGGESGDDSNGGNGEYAVATASQSRQQSESLEESNEGVRMSISRRGCRMSKTGGDLVSGGVAEPRWQCQLTDESSTKQGSDEGIIISQATERAAWSRRRQETQMGGVGCCRNTLRSSSKRVGNVGEQEEDQTEGLTSEQQRYEASDRRTKTSYFSKRFGKQHQISQKAGEQRAVGSSSCSTATTATATATVVVSTKQRRDSGGRSPPGAFGLVSVAATGRTGSEREKSSKRRIDLDGVPTTEAGNSVVEGVA